ncbi:MAG TPA: hypothetical protein VJW75_00530 [Candidatus Eisenbacteria bacterium]|nr:hypothetical protein [Candidatus Eisenbacteria bacterium]
MAAASPRNRFASPLLYLIPLAILALPDLVRADGGPFLLHLERGDSMQVLRVEPATFGMFRYVRADSVEGYLSAHRVQSITDASGRDVTSYVLERRRVLGREPIAYGHEGSADHRASNREDRTFSVLEVGLYGRLSDREPPHASGGWMTGIDFGAMRNLSRSVSVGGTIHFETERLRDGMGIALRARRWLGDGLSIDGAGGWVFAGSDDRGAFKPNAFYGEVAVNLGDRAQLVTRVESWKWAARERIIRPAAASAASAAGTPPLPEGYEEIERELPASRETMIQLGGRFGAVPGVPLLLLFLLVVGVGPRSGATP